MNKSYKELGKDDIHQQIKKEESLDQNKNRSSATSTVDDGRAKIGMT